MQVNIICKMDHIGKMPFSTEWARELSQYRSISPNPAEDRETKDMVCQAAGGAFRLGDWTYRLGIHRSSTGKCITQERDLPWEYLYDCIKLSRKDFIIYLPKGIAGRFFSHINYGKSSLHYVLREKKISRAYAWYDPKADGILVFQLTGACKDEENTYPAYDGFGRYDTLYEIVEGVIGRDGHWVKEPECRFF